MYQPACHCAAMWQVVKLYIFLPHCCRSVRFRYCLFWYINYRTIDLMYTKKDWMNLFYQQRSTLVLNSSCIWDTPMFTLYCNALIIDLDLARFDLDHYKWSWSLSWSRSKLVIFYTEFFLSTGCLTVTVFFETPLFLDICWRSRLSFHVLNGHCGRFDFLKKKLKFCFWSQSGPGRSLA